MSLVKWRWLLPTAAIAAVLVAAAPSVATSSPRARAIGSALKPRTLVTTDHRIWAFGQDGGRIAWIGHGGRRCGLHVRTIRTGQTLTTPLHRFDCDPGVGGLVVADRTAAWHKGYSCGNNECFWNIATATAGGRRARVVDSEDEGCYGDSCQVGVTVGRPMLAGAGRLLVYSNGVGPVERIQHGRALPLFRTNGNTYGLAVGDGLIATTSETLAPGDGCGCLDLPAWSPDGSKIAYLHGHFARYGALNTAVGVMNADGSGRHVITATNGLASGSALSWSPDGTKIAYDGSPDGQIWIVSADGSSLSRLTQGSLPAWSPDGTKIAFVRRDSSTNAEGIFVVNPDGTNVQELTSFSQPGVGELAWSPDGTRIAFSFVGVLQMMNADGSNLHELGSAVNGNEPAWSPDGSEIAFHTPNGLWLIGADGRGLRQLTNGPDEQPSWSPDGRTIVFGSDRNDAYANIGVYDDGISPELYLVDPDGTDLRPLSFTQPTAWVNAVNTHSGGGKPLATVPIPGEPDFFGGMAIAGSIVAVAGRDGGAHQIALFDGRSGAQVGVVHPGGDGDYLSVVGGHSHWVVFTTRRGIFGLDVRTQEVVHLARVAGDAVSVSVSGRRVAWAENVNGRGRIRALQLPN